MTHVPLSDKRRFPAIDRRPSLSSCRVRGLLRRCEQEFGRACWAVGGSRGCTPTVFNQPWTEIVMACVHYRVGGLKLLLADSQVRDT